MQCSLVYEQITLHRNNIHIYIKLHKIKRSVTSEEYHQFVFVIFNYFCYTCVMCCKRHHKKSGKSEIKTTTMKTLNISVHN